LPLQSGTGKNGQWKKQDIIVETDGQYPKKVCISIWGDKIDEKQLQINNVLKLEFDIESREFNGKWYTDAKAWKIDVSDSAASAASITPASTPKSQDTESFESFPSSSSSEDDLPF
jgi:Domain of unknown function (DUF3127)